MKEIPLRARNGSVRAVALVDDADYAELASYRWCLRVDRHGKRYAQRSVPRKTTVLMHRQIMGSPEGYVDHWDGDGLNNRRSNLRVVDAHSNAFNRRGADRDSSTGYRGVTRHRGRFRAHATVRGRYHHLGIYDTPEEAARVAADFRSSVAKSA